MTIADTSDAPVAHSFHSLRLRLNYVDWGNPSAPLLLLVHGRQDHCRSWDAIARHYRSAWHVVAVDLRGHGDSEWSSSLDYGLSSYVGDLRALIEHLGCEQLTIIGHSLGGTISVRYTGLYPERVRSLVSIEGVGPSPKVLQERAAASIAAPLRHWLDERLRVVKQNDRRLVSLQAAYERMHEKNPHLSAEQAWHLARHAARVHADGSVNWKFDYGVLTNSPIELTLEQQASLWSRIDCPTLLVYGSESFVSSPQTDGRLQYFRHARFASVQGAGHWVHHDKLDEVLALIDAHLADSAAAPGPKSS